MRGPRFVLVPVLALLTAFVLGFHAPYKRPLTEFAVG